MRRLTPIFTRALARLRSERGFTMVTVMGVLMAGTILTGVAVGSVDGDIFGSQRDEDTKAAFAAAEAGINKYQFHLDRDNNYWTRCTSVPTSPGVPNPVNQRWNGAGTDPRVWREVPVETRADLAKGEITPRYTIELLPANGQAACSTTAPDNTMIDAATNTFRIRATGRSRGVTKSVVATFKRRSFLDYVYFTDIETADPTFLAGDPGYATWSGQNCARWWRDGRGTPTYSDGRKCTEINFVSGEQIKGPFHTNDEILICGTPNFGERPDDNIEVSGPPPGATREGWRPCSGIPGSRPTFTGSWRPRSPVLQLPLTNSKLKTIALPAYRYSGATDIVLSGATMRVNGGAAQALPSNGVIYVDSNPGANAVNDCQPYNLNDTYPNGNPPASGTPGSECANATVSGSYSQSLTIAAANDVIVKGNLTRASGSPALLGLIANQFVRVYHPVNGDGSNATGSTTNVQIDAAMLALNHVVVVDNNGRGAPLGTLNINGAIAQKFRGVVGRFQTNPDGSTSPVHGYTKNYVYDRRLRYREPPYFLDPVQASWHVLRQTEQVPAR